MKWYKNVEPVYVQQWLRPEYQPTGAVIHTDHERFSKAEHMIESGVRNCRAWTGIKPLSSSHREHPGETA